MNKLTPNQLLMLNRKITKGIDPNASGESAPISPDRMQLIIEIARAPYETNPGNFYIYKGIVRKAARLGCVIVGRRPFERGNHGTAVLALMTLLTVNGYTFPDYKKDVDILCRHLDAQDMEMCCAWIEEHAVAEK